MDASELARIRNHEGKTEKQQDAEDFFELQNNIEVYKKQNGINE